MATKIPNYLSDPILHIHFWDDLVAMLETWGSSSTKEWRYALAQAERQIKRLRHVTEVNFEHQCWARLEPTAQTWEGIQQEVEETYHKIMKVLARLKKAA